MEHRIFGLSNSIDIVAVNMVAIRHLSARIALERRHAVPAVDSSESLLLVPYFLFRAPAVAADMTVVAVCKRLVLIFVTCFVPLKRKSYSGTGLHDCGADTKEGCLLICLSLPRASCLPPLENGDWLKGSVSIGCCYPQFYSRRAPTSGQVARPL